MMTFNGIFGFNPQALCGDKSITHRAFILAATADGKCVIENACISRDTLATARCMEKLGAKFVFDGATVTVYPFRFPADDVILDCGNSGTTARLLAGVTSGLGVRARFIGDSSLSRRPMERVLTPLRAMGARFSRQDGCLFVTEKASLTGADITADGASAQVKSAVLLAALFADGVTSYTELTRTRRHTENMLNYLGHKVKTDGLTLSTQSGKIRAFRLHVPGDMSAAAFPVALALMTGNEVTLGGVCVSAERRGFIDVLRAAGAQIILENRRVEYGEEVADVSVKKSFLKPLTASADDIVRAVDEVPALAAVALSVKGVHRFYGTEELRFKESDRIEALVALCRAVGQTAFYNDGCFTVESNGVFPKCAEISSFADHRIAMAGAVAAMASGKGSVDDDAFDVSWPGFCDMFCLKPYRFALIGCGVKDSLSPCLMKHLASGADVVCRYETVDLPEDASDDEITAMAASYDGVNVTMPFKRRAAALFGADCPSVNTLGVNIAPQSTDGTGTVKALERHGIDVRGKKLWIVGAGGAAEAAIRALLQSGAEIRVWDRTPQRAEYLTEKYGLSKNIHNPFGVLSFVPVCAFEDDFPLPDSAKFLFRADYKGTSALESAARKKGIVYVSGEEMLYYQGAASFALWTSTPLQDDPDPFLREVAKRRITFDG